MKHQGFEIGFCFPLVLLLVALNLVMEVDNFDKHEAHILKSNPKYVSANSGTKCTGQ